MALSTDDLDGDRPVWTFRVSRWDPKVSSNQQCSSENLRLLTPRGQVLDRTDPNERRMLEVPDEGV